MLEIRQLNVSKSLLLLAERKTYLPHSPLKNIHFYRRSLNLWDGYSEWLGQKERKICSGISAHYPPKADNAPMNFHILFLFYFSFISYLLLFWFKPFSQITWINSLIWLLQNNGFDLRLRLAVNDCKQIEPNASIGQPMRLCKWLINKLCMSSHTLESFQVRKYLTLDPELNIVFASEE